MRWTAGSGAVRRVALSGGQVRYRDIETNDLDAARKAVCTWLDQPYTAAPAGAPR
jgi:hypothetical protein